MLPASQIHFELQLLLCCMSQTLIREEKPIGDIYEKIRWKELVSTIKSMSETSSLAIRKGKWRFPGRG